MHLPVDPAPTDTVNWYQHQAPQHHVPHQQVLQYQTTQQRDQERLEGPTYEHEDPLVGFQALCTPLGNGDMAMRGPATKNHSSNLHHNGTSDGKARETGS